MPWHLRFKKMRLSRLPSNSALYATPIRESTNVTEETSARTLMKIPMIGCKSIVAVVLLLLAASFAANVTTGCASLVSRLKIATYANFVVETYATRSIAIGRMDWTNVLPAAEKNAAGVLANLAMTGISVAESTLLLTVPSAKESMLQTLTIEADCGARCFMPSKFIYVFK